MSESENAAVVILGSGGHASVLAEICLEQGRQILAVVSPEPIVTGGVFQGVRHLREDHAVLEFSAKEILLVNGVGGLPGNQVRERLASRFSELGYVFATIVSGSAIVSRYAKLEEGAQILSAATINAGAWVGAHSIINTGAVVEHGCRIYDFVQVSPGSTLCGGVVVNQRSTIGPGAVIGQGLTIGCNTIIGAGASVVRSVGDGKLVLPARSRIEDG